MNQSRHKNINTCYKKHIKDLNVSTEYNISHTTPAPKLTGHIIGLVVLYFSMLFLVGISIGIVDIGDSASMVITFLSFTALSMIVSIIRLISNYFSKKRPRISDSILVCKIISLVMRGSAIFCTTCRMCTKLNQLF